MLDAQPGQRCMGLGGGGDIGRIGAEGQHFFIAAGMGDAVGLGELRATRHGAGTHADDLRALNASHCVGELAGDLTGAQDHKTKGHIMHLLCSYLLPLYREGLLPSTEMTKSGFTKGA